MAADRARAPWSPAPGGGRAHRRWGLLVAALTSLGLWGIGSLDGPALVGGTALAESLLGAGAGALWGLWTLTRHRAGVIVDAKGGDRDRSSQSSP